jgi:hypothetical protein
MRFGATVFLDFHDDHRQRHHQRDEREKAAPVGFTLYARKWLQLRYHFSTMVLKFRKAR